MRTRVVFWISAIVLTVAAAAGVSVAQRRGATLERPGPMGGGTTLLPNGWRIAPAGRHLFIGDLPLAMTLSPDGSSLIVANNGYQRPALRVVDLSRQEVAVVQQDDAWLGLAWHPDGTRLFTSGAASNTVQQLSWANGALRAGQKIPVSAGTELVRPPATRPPAANQTFVGGIAVSRDGARLFAVHVFGEALSTLDLATNQIEKTIKLPAEPYTCLLSPDGRTLFVSLWGGAKVLVFDAVTLESKGEISVGEHPNAMVMTSDGARLFVACANTNAVWAIDVATLKATEQISTSLFPKAPAGSTPNAVALSADNTRLLVANADNNTVAFVDVAKAGQSRVLGFIPTGWYPTGVLFSRDGSQIFVLSGKGLTSAANPRGSQAGIPGGEGQYSGSMLEGSLSIVPTPDSDTLARYTRTVYSVTPYSDDTRLAPASAIAQSPIPARVGGNSPIKHVFYIVRENRTYDQILGDLDRGNGDSNLALFGETITPNAHALAREFVTFDNFYVDAEVSYDGHAFSMGAYASDFTEKIWPINYGGRGGLYLSEGGGKMRNQYGNIAAGPNGYIWDVVLKAGKTVRSYGEFVSRDTSRTPMAEPSTDPAAAMAWAARQPVKASVPGLEGRIHPNFPPFDLKIPDNQRTDIWLEEFREFEKNGQLPALNVIRLGNDHTNGTRTGFPTPRAMVAENDVALGRIVDAVSHSVYWKDSAIFVVEDDAQNGPDHVDAHRSPIFVASPYARRGVVDSTLYTTSGMLRTMELILGLPPMSQYDAAATPMFNSFTNKADLTPFKHHPATYDLTERNSGNAPGAQQSAAWDFSKEDSLPDIEFNEVIWMSVHGANSRMPAPVRSAFVRAIEDDDDEDDDKDKDREREKSRDRRDGATRRQGEKQKGRSKD